MAHLAGGAEAHARFKQYEYRASSSLVLTTDSRLCDTRQLTGEPESLWGKIDPMSFGDRAYWAKSPELEEKLNKLKKKKDRDPAFDATTQPTSKKRRLHEESVLTSSDEGLHRPKAKVSRAAYEAMLNVIQQQLGDVSGAGDEILEDLKSDRAHKKKEIEELLKPLPNHTFDLLVSYCTLITD